MLKNRKTSKMTKLKMLNARFVLILNCIHSQYIVTQCDKNFKYHFRYLTEKEKNTTISQNYIY